jgi:hypothetical protein
VVWRSHMQGLSTKLHQPIQARSDKRDSHTFTFSYSLHQSAPSNGPNDPARHMIVTIPSRSSPAPDS